MSAGQNASLGVASSTEPSTTTVISDREQTKIDFYNTYDAMTGIRIAATLGGFFGLMVILVVYKSKSKTEKALENPKLAAAAVAEVEQEEQRQIQAALEATVYQQINPGAARRSLDISNSPAAGWVRSTRFSSIGCYSSLMEPPTRPHSRLPCFIDEDVPADEDECEDLSTYNRYLDVPRRPSNITCSSSDYLERRGSSIIMGLPAVPAHKSCGRRRQSSVLQEQYDFYYPIDIRIIQPTPGGSPCGSDRALYDNILIKNIPPVRRAPLASISSCNSSIGVDYPDFEMQSFASDSVFHEDDCIDTDDEVDPFSTDSDTSECTEHMWYRRHKRTSLKNRRISEFIPVIKETRENEECKVVVNEFRGCVSEHDLITNQVRPRMQEKSLSLDVDGSGPSIQLHSQRAPYPLPSELSSDTLVASGNGSSVTLPTLPLVERAAAPNLLKKEGSWSQETLF